MSYRLYEREVTHLCHRLACLLISTICLGGHVFSSLSITICITMVHVSFGNRIEPHAVNIVHAQDQKIVCAP